MISSELRAPAVVTHDDRSCMMCGDCRGNVDLLERWIQVRERQ
jgi:hypothetical protein